VVESKVALRVLVGLSFTGAFLFGSLAILIVFEAREGDTSAAIIVLVGFGVVALLVALAFFSVGIFLLKTQKHEDDKSKK
jgi:hypothetical protein